MKTVLITAGGTAEPIDNIRSITNTGTGALGSLIAEAFAKDPQVEHIIYVHGRGAILPKTDKAECIEAAYTKRLEETMQRLLVERKPDAIVHSMAVSDYCVESVVSAKDLAQLLENAASGAEDRTDSTASGAVDRTENAASGADTENAASAPASSAKTHASDRLSLINDEARANRLSSINDESAILQASKPFDLRDIYNKIPSSVGHPVILLKPTPKIIPQLKALAPNAVLVGFKLLDDVPHDELLSVAKRLMEKNDCDLVLANDYTTVKAGQHTGYLMAKDGGIETFVGKPAIAEGIAAAVKRRWEQALPL